MSIFRFGLGLGAVSSPGVDGAEVFARIKELVQAGEQAGIDAVFVPDHVWQNDRGGTGRDAPMLEAYTLLGALAACTTTTKLGALVSAVTFRNPAILAKTVTTLDVISNGRAILGLGAAWDEPEHEAYGIDFPVTKERMDRLEEALQICRAMFRDSSPSFHGSYYSIDKALNQPRPLSSVPILVGGGGEQRTLLAVAKYADACNVFGDAAAVRAKLDVLEAHCQRVGRDPAEITKTAGVRLADTKTVVADAKSLFDVGVDALILAGPLPAPAELASTASALVGEFGAH